MNRQRTIYVLSPRRDVKATIQNKVDDIYISHDTGDDIFHIYCSQEDQLIATLHIIKLSKRSLVSHTSQGNCTSTGTKLRFLRSPVTMQNQILDGFVDFTPKKQFARKQEQIKQAVDEYRINTELDHEQQPVLDQGSRPQDLENL